MTHILFNSARRLPEPAARLLSSAVPAILFAAAVLVSVPALAEGTADDPHAGHQSHGTHAPPAPSSGSTLEGGDTGAAAGGAATGGASGAGAGASGAATGSPGPRDGATPDAAHDAHRHHRRPAPLQPAPDPAQAQGLATEPAAHDAHSGRHESHGADRFLWLRADQLEAVDGADGTALQWKGSLSWGDTFNRVWLASEGEREEGSSHELQTRLFWSHAVSPWWDATLGLRQDNGSGDSRSWVGIGLRGLAPYWFETEATLYAGEGGQALLEIDVDYELLMTNRLILEPELELRVHGRDDAARGEGAGLADSSIGLRLRYEFSRKFAPYLGVEWTQLQGNTRDLAEAAGERVHDTRAVAGLRFWY